MSLASRLPLLALVLTLAGCPSNPPKPEVPGSAIVPDPPEKSVFIRASFDDDPSEFIGRFLPDDLAQDRIDETAAKVGGRCGKFLSKKTVNASGTFEQTFNASNGVKGSLGVKPFGSISAGTSSDAGLLVKYAMTKKMLVTVSDADGLARCCESAPAECGTQMIGEFWFGTGTVSQFAGRESDISASVSKGKVDADFSYKDGWGWKRVSSFENAYFAFRTTAGPTKSRLCEGNWQSEVPQSLDGQYFVGVAAVLAPEPKAREEAMRNARREVVKYLGERLTETYSGESSTIGGALADSTLVTAAAEGLAERVKDRCWTQATSRSTPEGPFTELKVLAFFPAEQEKAAQAAAIQAMADTAAVQKKASAKPLANLAKKLKP